MSIATGTLQNGALLESLKFNIEKLAIAVSAERVVAEIEKVVG